MKSARKKFPESPRLTSPRKETGVRDQIKIFDLGGILWVQIPPRSKIFIWSRTPVSFLGLVSLGDSENFFLALFITL